MAQLNRHFLPPVALQQAQREQAQRRQAAQAAPRREGSRAEQLAALAAGEAAVAAAFRAAEADERNPVAAVHAATAAVSAAARAPAAEGSPQAQARGGEVQEAQEARRFRAFAYLTQLQQALAYQTAVHRWRRGKAEAQARTAGVLYWQLNDVWAGPSWSGINADGSWRLLHHAAVEFFRPVLVRRVHRGPRRCCRCQAIHARGLTNSMPKTPDMCCLLLSPLRPSAVVSETAICCKCISPTTSLWGSQVCTASLCACCAARRPC